jgi:hypothetical protein
MFHGLVVVVIASWVGLTLSAPPPVIPQDSITSLLCSRNKTSSGSRFGTNHSNDYLLVLDCLSFNERDNILRTEELVGAMMALNTKGFECSMSLPKSLLCTIYAQDDRAEPPPSRILNSTWIGCHYQAEKRAYDYYEVPVGLTGCQVESLE